MGRVWISFLIMSVIVVLLLPLILVKGCSGASLRPGLDLEVYDHRQGRYFSIDMEDYVKGVVAGEISPKAPFEALKAQAIAARTYALHKKGQLTTDFNTDQCYYSVADLKERWGAVNFLFYWNRLLAATKETQGIVMIFEEKPILAVYHANSGGATEDSALVWGEGLPYLKSKASPFDQEDGRWRQDFRFSQGELIKRLRLPLEGISKIEINERSDSGRVLKAQIEDYSFSGRELREALSLPSTLFEWSFSNEQLHVTAFGRGHGVGMSQDGAVYLAQQGYNCFQILNYYYDQIKFSKIY